MTRRAWGSVRLVRAGAGPRLALAAGVAGLLWLGFLWATGPVGG